jgi:predicted RNA-binding protein (TIGR00451 family)
LSKYLYGADILPDDIVVKGRGQRQAFSGKKPVASIGDTLRPLIPEVSPEKGWVMVDFDVVGDIFCAGVLDSDPDIRAGDDIIVMRHGKAVAVGTAQLPGTLMQSLQRGKAVKVRKKIR